MENESLQGSCGKQGMTPDEANSIAVQLATQTLLVCLAYTSRSKGLSASTCMMLSRRLRETLEAMRCLSSSIDETITNGSWSNL